ncbi:MAG TPA: hypothetical protein DIW47_06790 [Bacteroidetes bacterium]|nr:hypothetical protein [Bacteroidota bacterium]
MKKGIVLLFVSYVLASPSLAQDWQKYAELVEEAKVLYHQKEYLKSGQKYAEAFVALDNKGLVTDRYNAACSWALAGERDSAFVQLFKIAQNADYSDLKHLISDSELDSLHSDKRWEELLALVKANKEKQEANYDKTLIAILDTILEEDQKYRLQFRGVIQTYGRESEEMKVLTQKTIEADSINQIKVSEILDSRGWLGPDIIGPNGSDAFFLVIQHADLKMQEQYLPMMREAVKKGHARASSLAMLEDRVALAQGKKQIYGSQIGRDPETDEYYVMPLEDPDNVDQRRAEVGLQPLAKYVALWNLTWDVEAYKKVLPEMEKKQKK